MPAHPLPDELVELIAQRFRALGEPMRIRLLEQLRVAPRTVQELAETVGTSQQNVSKHMGLLLSLGIVTRRRDGNQSWYEIGDDTVVRMCDEVCGAIAARAAALHRLTEEVR